VLAPNSGSTARNTVTIDNPYLSGTIELSKIVDGLGTVWADQVFTVDVACTLTDGSGSRSVWNQSYDLAAGAAPTQLLKVAAGADCSVTESKTGGATSTAITVGTAVPASGTSATFTSPSGATLPIVVTNTFDLASVDVTKAFTGAGSALWGAGPFEVTLACTRPVDGAHPAVVIPGGSTRVLQSPTFAASYDGLPMNADCTATETKTGGANGSTVSVGGSFALVGANTPVTVTNDFTEGQVSVTKDFSGLGVALYGNGPFEVSLECTRIVDTNTVTVAIPGGASRELNSGNGYAATFDHLPTGADCTATETKTGGATDSTGPVDVTIDNGGTQNASFTNTFDLGELNVTNIVTGNNWEPNSKWTFVVELICTLDVDGVPTDIAIPGGAVRDILHLGTVNYTDLPIGAKCTLEEIQTNNADEVAVSGDHSVPGPLGRVSHIQLKTLAIGATPVRFDVVNVYNIRLASTGTDPVPLGLLGLLVALLGVALYSGGQLRKPRA
jgi:hypothetical protein